jgi:hypothetical protein
MAILVFAVRAVFVQAQTNEDAAVPRLLPALNPDLMTYFQEEMTSHMRYQMSTDYNIPFFVSARYRTISLTESAVKEKDRMSDEDYTQYADNQFGNIFVEGQAKINDALYIPFFVVTAGGRIYGTPDAGSLTIDNRSSFDNAFIDESVNRYLFGGGLFANGKTIKGGIYAGYCLEHYVTNNSGSILDRQFGRWRSYSYEDDVWDHSLKIALLPALDTSNWKYVGNVLNTVFGYIGLGDSAEVYAGEEEKDKTAAAIVDALNYGLDFAFKKLEFDRLSLDPRLFYRRDNYDAVARADTYGVTLGGPFPRLPFGTFALRAEFGFKHFYSVSKYFQSRYSDTLFLDIVFSLSFPEHDAVLLSFESLSLAYRYDGVAKHSFTLSAIFSPVGAFVFELGFAKDTYNIGNFDMTKKSFVGGMGFRS